MLTDFKYETLRGAKIAFAKLYGNKAWREGIKAQWSHFYDPDASWMSEKISAGSGEEENGISDRQYLV